MARKHSRAKSRHIRVTNENVELAPEVTQSSSPLNLENMSPNPIFMTKGSIVLQN
jgi:hypothetical protein